MESSQITIAVTSHDFGCVQAVEDERFLLGEVYALICRENYNRSKLLPERCKQEPCFLREFILTVSKATSKVMLACSPKSTKVGKTIKCTATVLGYSPTWTGSPEISVTFSTSGAGRVTLSSVSCTAPRGNSFICLVTLTGATAGPVSITALYIGDPNNAPSTSASVSLIIKPS